MAIILEQLAEQISKLRIALENKLFDNLDSKAHDVFLPKILDFKDKSIFIDNPEYRYDLEHGNESQIHLKTMLNQLRDFEIFLAGIKNLTFTNAMEFIYLYPLVPYVYRFLALWPEMISLLQEQAGYDQNQTFYANLKNSLSYLLGFLPTIQNALNVAEIFKQQHQEVTLDISTASHLLAFAFKVASFPIADEYDDFAETTKKLDALITQLNAIAMQDAYLFNIAMPGLGLMHDSLDKLIAQANKLLSTSVNNKQVSSILTEKIQLSIQAYMSIVQKLENYEQEIGLKKGALLKDAHVQRVSELKKLYPNIKPLTVDKKNIVEPMTFAGVISGLSENFTQLENDKNKWVKTVPNQEMAAKIDVLFQQVRIILDALKEISEKTLGGAIFSSQWVTIAAQAYSILNNWNEIKGDLVLMKIDSALIDNVNVWFGRFSSAFTANNKKEVESKNIAVDNQQPSTGDLMTFASAPQAIGTLMTLLNIDNQHEFANFIELSENLNALMESANRVASGDLSAVMGLLNNALFKVGPQNLFAMQKNANQNLALTDEQKKLLINFLAHLNDTYKNILCKLDAWEEEYQMDRGFLTEQLAGCTNILAQLYKVANQYQVVEDKGSTYPYYAQRIQAAMARGHIDTAEILQKQAVNEKLDHFVQSIQHRYDALRKGMSNYSLKSFFEKHKNSAINQNRQNQIQFLIELAIKVRDNPTATAAYKIAHYQIALETIETEINKEGGFFDSGLKKLILELKAELSALKEQCNIQISANTTTYRDVRTSYAEVSKQVTAIEIDDGNEQNSSPPTSPRMTKK